ncbi:hypothetical protein BGZ65_003307 [Modicella reniformis]|uniref:Uncharacterized protein n=1 Tax=Modicella reniformis TaxID=1440133 RepID=A0A9P6LZP4_9FUNG|nr:hypothetical protein BGZ65_003307 [Modicella reniformis]
MAKEKYGEFFYMLFVGSQDLKAQKPYGKSTTTMNKVSEFSPSTHETVGKYVPKINPFEHVANPDGLKVYALAFGIQKPNRSSKARVWIKDIAEAFPDRSSIDTIFPETSKTLIVGVDHGEIVTAAFCVV